jgi:hypothetical protein
MSKLTILLLTIFMSSGAFAASEAPKAAENEVPTENEATTENEALPENEAPPEMVELVCTKVPVTGSHMKIKTCRTKAQAKDERKRSRSYIERIKMQPITEGNKG